MLAEKCAVGTKAHVTDLRVEPGVPIAGALRRLLLTWTDHDFVPAYGNSPFQGVCLRSLRGGRRLRRWWCSGLVQIRIPVGDYVLRPADVTPLGVIQDVELVHVNQP